MTKGKKYIRITRYGKTKNERE